MKIVLKDIEAIINWLQSASSKLDTEIEELEKKGFEEAVAEKRYRKEKVTKCINTILTIKRKNLPKDHNNYN